MTDSGPPIDGVDAHILSVLLGDGRASYRAISDRVGVSATTVAERVRRLQRDGVIEGFEPRVDHAKLGYDTVAAFRIRAATGTRGRLAACVTEYRSMVSVFEVAGRYDVLAVGRFPDTDGVRACARDLRDRSAVDEVTTTVVLDAVLPYRQFGLPEELVGGVPPRPPE
jgi:Lrp/AsnC family transcriptional regulator for asnA, asnC and gidA